MMILINVSRINLWQIGVVAEEEKKVISEQGIIILGDGDEGDWRGISESSDPSFVLLLLAFILGLSLFILIPLN